MNESEDTRLFAAFMREYRALERSPEKAGIAGISSRQLRRYDEKKPPTRLEPDTRVAMSRFVTSRGVKGFEHLAVAATHGIAGGYLARKIDEILARPVSAVMQALLIAEISAAYRAEALQMEAASAQTRTGVLSADVAGAEQAQDAEEQLAADRSDPQKRPSRRSRRRRDDSGLPDAEPGKN